LRLEKATTAEASMGPTAIPVNLEAFRKPTVPPLGLSRNSDMTSGMAAAAKPVWIILTTVKSAMPRVRASIAWKATPMTRRNVIICRTPNLLESRVQTNCPIAEVAV